MAVTNWKSVGESIHQGDMDRARLALDARRVAMAEQAQQFNQQRQMHQDAEAKRIGERAYQDSRADLKYDRDSTESRFDKEYGLKKEANAIDANKTINDSLYKNATLGIKQREAAYKAREAESKAREVENKVAENAFKQMLDADKHALQIAKFNQESEKLASLAKQQEEERMAKSASLASLLAYGFTHGDRDPKGTVFIPSDAIQLFNQGLGAGQNDPNALGGVVMMTRDMAGRPLAIPQVAVLGRNGQAEVMNSEMLRGLFGNYPGLADSLRKGFPDDANNWIASLGLQPQQEQGQVYDRTLADYYKSNVENASKRLSASYSSVREGAGTEDREALRRAEAEQKLFLKSGYMPTEEEVEAYLNPKEPDGSGGSAVKDVDLGGYNPIDPLGARTRSIRTSN